MVLQLNQLESNLKAMQAATKGTLLYTASSKENYLYPNRPTGLDS